MTGTVKLIGFSALVVKTTSQRPIFFVYLKKYEKVKRKPEPGSNDVALIGDTVFRRDGSHARSGTVSCPRSA